MRKFALAVLALSALCVVLSGCDAQPQSNNRPTQATPPPPPDVSQVVASAIELREEKLFLVDLKFKKENFTLDPFKHIGNELKAEVRTIVVGERTYNGYTVGQKLSDKGDLGGFIFNGEIASYTITVNDKRTESQYFWVSAQGVKTEITGAQYNEALRQLKESGRPVLTVPFAGVVRNQLLDKPLSEVDFVKYEPLKRYFVTVEVKNSTFTIDITKHIRNAANTHEITIEVPEESYEKVREVWDPRLATGSAILNGRFSTLHGRVVKKWSEVDPAYQLAVTRDGKRLVIPAGGK